MSDLILAKIGELEARIAILEANQVVSTSSHLSPDSETTKVVSDFLRNAVITAVLTYMSGGVALAPLAATSLTAGAYGAYYENTDFFRQFGPQPEPLERDAILSAAPRGSLPDFDLMRESLGEVTKMVEEIYMHPFYTPDDSEKLEIQGIINSLSNISLNQATSEEYAEVMTWVNRGDFFVESMLTPTLAPQIRLYVSSLMNEENYPGSYKFFEPFLAETTDDAEYVALTKQLSSLTPDQYYELGTATGLRDFSLANLQAILNNPYLLDTFLNGSDDFITYKPNRSDGEASEANFYGSVITDPNIINEIANVPLAGNLMLDLVNSPALKNLIAEEIGRTLITLDPSGLLAITVNHMIDAKLSAAGIFTSQNLKFGPQDQAVSGSGPQLQPGWPS